jgi:hypothetical protein
LVKLEILFLDGNYGTYTGGLPTDIGNLTNLNILMLQSAGLSGLVPPSITKLTNLGTTDISGNCLFTDNEEVNAFMNLKFWDWNYQYLPGCQKTFDKEKAVSGDEITVTLKVYDVMTGYCMKALNANVKDILDEGLVFVKAETGYPVPEVKGQTLEWIDLGPP